VVKPLSTADRTAIGALVLSAAGFVGIIAKEGWEERARPPVKGDVCTGGFGTAGVPCGEVVNPVVAAQRALRDVRKFEASFKRCVYVPLFQHEYDAYISLSYNIGDLCTAAKTLVIRLNAQDYWGACAEIARHNKFLGKALPGLTVRRQAEMKQCYGDLWLTLQYHP